MVYLLIKLKLKGYKEDLGVLIGLEMELNLGLTMFEIIQMKKANLSDIILLKMNIHGHSTIIFFLLIK